ncbi:ABC transporter substrate-binding protein [Paenibacillus hodogayensis]|uniref:ABC transporter substrate-binding protein n=1 Tax=Paenibacillus hodogayensis TaxID=279208 RepID=A0ABV5VWS0_9BACL
MNVKFQVTALAALALSVGLLGGCASDQGAKESQPGKAAPPKEEGIQVDLQTPVKLLFYDESNMAPEVFEERFAQPVKKKFPNVTFEVIKPGKGTYVSELAASGIAPDMFMATSWSFPLEINTKLIANMDEWIAKDRLDLGTYQPTIIDTIKSFSPNGGLYALPYSNYASALYYNKDIFDKFALPYPKDGMSYEEAIELGKKLTRTDGGVQYSGFYPGNYSFTYALFNKGYVDAANGKMSFNNAEMKQTFELLKSGFASQGMEYIDYAAALNKFYKDKTLAMIPYHFDSGRLEAETKAGNVFNWELAQAPTYQGYNRSGVPNLLAIGSQSKNTALVYKIISYLSASVEYQTFLSEKGVLPVLKNDAVVKTFASSLGSLKGKHLEALTKAKPQSFSGPTQYDRVPDKYLTQALKDVISGSSDINSALSKAEEQANKDLQGQLK